MDEENNINDNNIKGEENIINELDKIIIENPKKLEMPNLIRSNNITISEAMQEEPEEIEQPEEIEISNKIKKRKDYIEEIRNLSIKLDVDIPKKLHQMKKEQLKKKLAQITEEAALKLHGIEERQQQKHNMREAYAVAALYNLNRCFLSVVENVSYSFKDKLGGRYCKDIIKNLDESEYKQEQLKAAVKGVYLEYKDEIDKYISPLSSLLLINLTLIMESLKKEENIKSINIDNENKTTDKKMESEVKSVN